ncbi:hypothetical protein LRH25_01170 [Ideonella azotifigens]|nr:hypothetical protein [Ideonella azotifigens]MCD2338949.1 hypothetical protein [Ideonella azotifigens]
MRRLLTCLTTALLAACALPAAHAQGKLLDDEALSETWGQALITLDNTSYLGLDFTRLTLDADIRLSANFNNLRLGEYSWAARNGTGADIDIGTLHFGRSDATAAQTTVSITHPYFEFVTNGATKEVVGMRLGFGGISGDIGLTMNAVSGSLLIDAGSAGSIDSRNDTLGGKRWDGTTCISTATCTVALSQIGGVTAGNADGASRDFFLSVLKQSVNFPTVNTAVGAPDTALAGLWLNWRDRLTAINTTGTVPVNTGKGP